MEPADQRTQLERLQAELAVRQSTTFFAQAAISLAIALILAGTAAKLFWDSVRLPIFGIAVAALSVGLAAVAISRYRRGRVALRIELERFARLEQLRRALGLDDPSSLLPSQ